MAVTTITSGEHPPETDLHAIVQARGKVMEDVPWSTAVGSVILLPLWWFVLFPMAKVWKWMNTTFLSSNQQQQQVESSLYDSGFQVKQKEILPRAQRTYDVVVLGATGFTGQLAVRYLCRTYGVNKKQIKFAIAGRSQSKLNAVKEHLAQELGMPEIMDHLPTILVDTTQPAQVAAMVRQTRVVATTAGPFSLYSNAVVELCAKTGTHYADISAELDWMHGRMEQWQSTAQKTGARILTLCGCDSVPWDLMVWKMSELYKERTGCEMEMVEFWDECHMEASGGSMATAVELANKYDNTDISSRPLFQQPLDQTKNPGETMNVSPKIFGKTTLPWNGQPSFTTPFTMTTVNHQAVSWSRALMGHGPLRYKEQSIAPDLKTAYFSWIWGKFGMCSLKNPITLKIAQQFVLMKPGQGPDLVDMQVKYFGAMYARGSSSASSNKHIEALLFFPHDPGYFETARMLTEAALALACQEDQLPAVLNGSGGFFPPSVALGQVYLDRLLQTGSTLAYKFVGGGGETEK